MEQHIRLMAALKMFELGKLSSGKAAELAGMPRVEFFEACSRYHVSLFNYPDNEIEAMTADLDQGEKEVIHIGASVNGEVTLLLDDQAGRKAAIALNLPVVGTAGILLLAKKRGLIEAVTPLIAKLRERGYWLLDYLVAHVRELAGEQAE